MASNYKPIGQYIHLIDNRNTDLKIDKLVGLTVEKMFIPSVANIIGTDLSKYKIISEHQFACSLMQVSRDGKMPVAMYKGESAIMSPAYPMFEVNDENELMPEYLQMYLSRSEFDREAVFYAIGGVRGSLEWEDFCNMKLPVPPITEQRRIVNEYQTVERRIRNNEALIQKLEETAQAIYYHTFVEGIDEENLPSGWKKEYIGKFCNIFTGKKDVNESTPLGAYRFFSCSPDIFYSNEYIGEGPAVLVSGNGSYTGRVSFYDNKFDLYQRKYACTPLKDCEKYIYYIYAVMKYSFERVKMGGTRGTSIPYIVYGDIADFEFNFNKDKALEFNKDMKSILDYILMTEQENTHLRELLTLLTSKLS